MVSFHLWGLRSNPPRSRSSRVRQAQAQTLSVPGYMFSGQSPGAHEPQVLLCRRRLIVEPTSQGSCEGLERHTWCLAHGKHPPTGGGWHECYLGGNTAWKSPAAGDLSGLPVSMEAVEKLRVSRKGRKSPIWAQLCVMFSMHS